MPNSPTEDITDGSVHECWSVIAGLAATTSRLRLGSLVSPTTVRHPAVLANVAATIDQMSEGRLTLGIGAGWQVNEHRAYGIDLMSPKDRVDRFEEAIQIIRLMLSQERTTFQGTHFQITDAPCQPTPKQSPLPLLVGTGGPRMSAITARYADQWNTWGHVDGSRQTIGILDRACESVGRDPSTIHRSVQALFFKTHDAASTDAIRSAAPGDRSIIGDQSTMVESLQAYRDIGFDEVIIPDFTLGRDASARHETYLWFAEEVLPHI
jgi:alkanesulfonate monooxygenase SsuD/methylene tetrahydromethanopterin reductase-like flavin-dependent oxidoreductase (luciferase family)